MLFFFKCFLLLMYSIISTMFIGPGRPGAPGGPGGPWIVCRSWFCRKPWAERSEMRRRNESAIVKVEVCCFFLKKQLFTSDKVKQICGVSMGTGPLAVSWGTWGPGWSWRSLEDPAVIVFDNVVQNAVGWKQVTAFYLQMFIYILKCQERL